MVKYLSQLELLANCQNVTHTFEKTQIEKMAFFVVF